MTLKSRIISVVSGGLFSIAWFLVLDGISISSIIREGNPALLIKPHFDQPRVYWYHVIPSILASLFVVLLNLVSIKDLYNADNQWNDGISTKVRLWVFTMASGLTICMGSTIWINAVSFSRAYNAWPGITLMLNILLQAFAGILFFGAR